MTTSHTLVKGFGEPQKRVPVWEPEWEYPLGTERPLTPEGESKSKDEEGEDDEDEDDENEDSADEGERRAEKDKWWIRANRVLVLPELIDSHIPFRERPEGLTHINLRKDWKEQGLQVITKLANIELRPEEGKTSYEGGTWHIEGQLNEHIRASAIYYHDQLNVTKSRLVFRQLTNGRMLEEMNYPQDDYEGIEQLFGFKHHRPCLQNLGSVVTKEGRLLVFPNVLQH
ncbi:hypothetical protein AAF712_008625 [Marasmius tenuissimus]|uniref:DUF4246 domain-containing protein n=1 Tax=Marasmius tenuissimus TaxID=585030 RepID=A0ABR2ZS11_9AGAR